MEAEIQQLEDTSPLIPEHTKQATIAASYLLFFSTLMFTLPFAAFYGTKYYLQESFNIHNEFTLNAWSVFASVLTVNIIIMLYAAKAYFETEYDEEGNELNKDGSRKDKKLD